MMDGETHTVIPGRYLRAEETVTTDELPVTIEVVRYLQNSELLTPDELDEEIAGIETQIEEQLSESEVADIEEQLASENLAPGERAELKTLLNEQLSTEQIAGLREFIDDARQLETLATRGIGAQRIAIPVRASTGTDTGGAVDATAAYVKLTDRETGEDLGTWLLSIDFDWFSLGWNPQTISAGGCDYAVQLRFERTYKPYTITLNDIRKEDYVGTNTPRDYSSFVRLEDERSGTDRDDVRIWMNNPLRYGGETFYQSSYYPANAVYRGSGEWTSLQVVKNTGWMIPYVSCMIVAVGMCAQFGLVLWRFLQRREREQSQSMASVELLRRDSESRKSQAGTGRKSRQDQPAVEESVVEEPRGSSTLVADWILPAAIVLIFASYLGSKTRVPSTPDGHFDVQAFGNLPIVYQGRPKPIDTLARNSLLIVSDRQEFTGRINQLTWRDTLDEGIIMKPDVSKGFECCVDADFARGFCCVRSNGPQIMSLKNGTCNYARPMST